MSSNFQDWCNENARRERAYNIYHRNTLVMTVQAVSQESAIQKTLATIELEAEEVIPVNSIIKD